jgi:uncharacterized peroxidase-related enzyme
MSDARILPLHTDAAGPEARAALDRAAAAIGATPNFVRVIAHSPDALNAFTGFFGLAAAGALDHKTRERIALAVAQQNSCQYCVSAHTALGRNAGLDAAEILANRQGASSDPKAAAALAFARALVDTLGDVTSAEFDAVRDAGHSDAEIVEIIGHVALNIFTNLIGKATKVAIDFPKVELTDLATAA